MEPGNNITVSGRGAIPEDVARSSLARHLVALAPDRRDASAADGLRHLTSLTPAQEAEALPKITVRPSWRAGAIHR
jgi:hypothetical protein